MKLLECPHMVPLGNQLINFTVNNSVSILSEIAYLAIGNMTTVDYRDSRHSWHSLFGRSFALLISNINSRLSLLKLHTHVDAAGAFLFLLMIIWILPVLVGIAFHFGADLWLLHWHLVLTVMSFWLIYDIVPWNGILVADESIASATCGRAPWSFLKLWTVLLIYFNAVNGVNFFRLGPSKVRVDWLSFLTHIKQFVRGLHVTRATVFRIWVVMRCILNHLSACSYILKLHFAGSFVGKT